MEKWNFKTVVITGANSGIGFAILRKLAQAGMKAVGFDIVTDNMERLAREFGNKIFYQQVDVCDYESLRRAFRYVEETCGGLDVLINNAGIMSKGHIFGDRDENMEGILKTIDTNFSGTVRCCRLAYNLMKRKDFGYIINFNSADGHYVPMNYSTNSYAGSKYAITAITEVLRQELINMKNNRIKVTSISPGAVETEFYKSYSEQYPGRMYDHQGRMYENHQGRMYENYQGRMSDSQRLKPEDVADAVFYLLSTPNSVNVTEMTIRPTASSY